MNARNLLLLSLFCLLGGSVFGQKKKKKITIHDQIEQYIFDSNRSDKLTDGDLVITLIDSSGSKKISQVALPGVKVPPEELIFELGDLTQVFTSLLVHELAIDGRLDLKISINTLLPEGLQSTYFQDVSLQDCLSHTTGLPRLPNNIGAKQLDHNQPFEFYKPSDLAAFIRQWKPSDDERNYQYSLIGYELVGIILEHQFNQSFGQLIKDVLNPIYAFESLCTGSLGPLRKGRNKVGNEVEPMRFSSFLASSGLRSNSKDLGRILLDPEFRSRKAFLETLKIQANTAVDSSVSIASGWHQYTVNRHHTFYLHKGSTMGFSSFMAYHPNSQTGVVILSSKKVNLGPMGYYIMGQLNGGWKK